MTVADTASVGTPDRPTPRFSIVTAVYNVARFLPDFIDSIERQYLDLSKVEVIAVDDGSTDESLAVLQEWAERRPDLVTVLTKPNGGQGSARNLGIEHATGEWITFPDPDDTLEPGYLSIVDDFLTANPSTEMIGTYRIFLMEHTGKRSDTHPLRRMFKGDRLLDLRQATDAFHGSAPAAFFRGDVLQRENLRFDGRIRPNFEDGHFCARYLLAVDIPMLGLLKSAEYIYRKRADGSSTLQNSVKDEGRYLDVPRYGYLDVLSRGAERFGSVPEWLQNFVMYELSWYFSADLAMSGGSAARGAVADRFVENLRQMVSYLDPVVIDGFRTRHFDRLWRDICLHGLGRDAVWHTPYVVTQRRDVGRGLVRIAYRYVGPAPTEEVVVRGQPVQVEFGKTRVHEFFDHTMMYERIAWVPLDGTLRILLNGTAVNIQPGWEPIHNTTVRDWQVREWFEAEENTATAKTARPTISAVDRALVTASKSPNIRRKYAGAWVLIDRIHDADDNAERLFRYLRAERADINAWFVLEKGTPDWDRMVGDGYRDRMVAHGSAEWKLLMLNCRHLVSSHADAPIHRPPGVARLNAAEWNVTFLQHGVIKDDLSRWLNPKALDLFVTSTPAEQASVVGDDTQYVYTTKEARMTGLPRFDRLLQLGSQVSPERRSWLLVCPTWRHWLIPPRAADTQRATVDDSFLESEFAKEWTAFLSDDRLAKIADTHNLRIGFLPHPNIQPALPQMNLPEHVVPLTFTGTDVQQLFAETALMVTDYSSMFFNAAYLDRPVVYFQFDGEEVLRGAHTGRPGYFQYERDGFGPVTATVPDAVDAVAATLDEHGLTPAPEYLERIRTAFPVRDGRCCERATAAIEDLSPKTIAPDRLAEALKQLRANPRVQKLVRSQRGRELVPKMKKYAQSSPLGRLLK